MSHSPCWPGHRPHERREMIGYVLTTSPSVQEADISCSRRPLSVAEPALSPARVSLFTIRISVLRLLFSRLQLTWCGLDRTARGDIFHQVISSYGSSI